MTLRVLLPDWPAPPHVRAVVTTRDGGVSSGRYASLNLGDHVGDRPAAVAENRARLARYLDLTHEPLWLRQVHGTAVLRADGPQGATPTADASVAFSATRPCTVLIADCLPVLICDRAGSAVAAAHAGWRGLAQGVLQEAVAALGCSPEDLLAWLGPAIGPRAFEVGPEVRTAFLRRSEAFAAGFAANARGRWQADLDVLARTALHRAGVAAVYGGGRCTHSQPETFFSYRRDGETGRMAAMIWLDSA